MDTKPAESVSLTEDREAFGALFKSYEDYLNKVFDRVLPNSDRKTLIARSVNDRELVTRQALGVLAELGYARTASIKDTDLVFELKAIWKGVGVE